MLVTGFFGEYSHVINKGLPTEQVLLAQGAALGLSSQIWGLLSGIAYFIIAYMVWFGEAKKLAVSAGGAVEKAHNTLAWFVLVGWAIYPLGYMLGTEGWYSGLNDIISLDMNVVYNVGDAVNKIGFGLVVYNLAVSK